MDGPSDTWGHRLSSLSSVMEGWYVGTGSYRRNSHSLMGSSMPFRRAPFFNQCLQPLWQHCETACWIPPSFYEIRGLEVIPKCFHEVHPLTAKARLDGKRRPRSSCLQRTLGEAPPESVSNSGKKLKNN